MATKKLQIVGSLVEQTPQVQADYSQTDTSAVDYIKNKPEVSNEPTENSEALITSGGVYNAIQNLGGGGATYTSGNFIDITDGVISSTLGNVTFKDAMEIPYTDVYTNDESPLPGFNMYMLSNEDDGGSIEYEHIILGCGDEITLYITDNTGTEFCLGTKIIEFNAIADSLAGSANSVICTNFNSTSTVTQTLTEAVLDPEDPSIPYSVTFAAIYNIMVNDGNYCQFAIFSKSDLSNCTFRIERKASTSVGITFLEDADTSTIPSAYVWGGYNETEYNVAEGDTIRVYTIDTDGASRYVGEGVLAQNSALDALGLFGSGTTTITANINSTSTVDETFTRLSLVPADPSIPHTFNIIYSTNYNRWTISALTDYEGVIIDIQVVKPIVNHIKLPDNALSFDSKPTEGSTNLVNSGDLYVALSDIYGTLGEIEPIVAEINSLIGGALS